MIGTGAEDAFIGRSARAIAVVLRADGSPSASMVTFVRDGDALVFSTTTDRGKGRALARDRRLLLTVVSGSEPHSYVTVEGTATLSDGPGDVELLRRIAEVDLRLGPFTARVDEQVQRLQAPRRVLVSLLPDRVAGIVVPLA